MPAAFGRLCVETGRIIEPAIVDHIQPPSGGCVLKPAGAIQIFYIAGPAAFGRLCVETCFIFITLIHLIAPAAFGRLCVETIFIFSERVI